MSMFFFIYTIAILCVCLSTASISLSAFVVSHRIKYLPQATFFIAYFIELASIFAGEWAVQNIGQINYDNYYAIDNPAFRIIIGAIVLVCFWLIIFDIIDEKSPWAVAVPATVLVISQTLILILMPYGPLRQWLFYGMRQVSLIGCLVYGLVKYKRSEDDVFHKRMLKRKRQILLLIVLIVLIIVEDTVVILVAPIPSGDNDFAGVFLSSRSVSENLMMCCIAATVIHQTVKDLALRFNEPPEIVNDAERDSNLLNHIENRLPRYAAEHSLSKREREILAFAMEGKTNREIATELFLAEGTVKTHLHNIMKKCETPNREELRKDFWAS